MWLNEHFPTLAEAEAFFGKEFEQVKASFARGGKFAVEDVPMVVTDTGGDYPLMRRAKVQNELEFARPLRARRLG
jgi:hypothetical protein